VSHIGYSMLQKRPTDLLGKFVIIFWYHITKLIRSLDNTELPKIFPIWNIIP